MLAACLALPGLDTDRQSHIMTPPLLGLKKTVTNTGYLVTIKINQGCLKPTRELHQSTQNQPKTPFKGNCQLTKYDILYIIIKILMITSNNGELA